MPPRHSLIDQPQFGKTFLLFLLPLIATNILQNLSGTINAIFVGKMMGVEAIAAISVFFPIIFFLLAFVIGLSAGTMVLIGQAWGAQDLNKVRSIVGSTLFLTLVGGTVIAVLGGMFAHPLLLLLGVDPAIMHMTLPYLQWMLFSSPILFVYIILTSILRGVGDSVTPLIALGLTSVLGLLITPALIDGYGFLPRLGIISPAIASIIGYLAVLVFLYYYLRKKKHPLQLDRELIKQIRYHPENTAMILKLGVPTGIQMVTNAAAGLVVIGLVNQHGAHATAAYGAVNQVLNYIQFPAISISIAASIFAAQAIGAGKAQLLSKVTKTALKMNLIFTGTLVILAYLFSKYLMALFITDPDVMELGQSLLFIVLWSYLFFGAAAIFAAIMRSSGTVTVPMLINIGAIALIELPCAYGFSSVWGLTGIWYAYALAFFMLCVMQGLYYQFFWKKKTVKILI